MKKGEKRQGGLVDNRLYCRKPTIPFDVYTLKVSPADIRKVRMCVRSVVYIVLEDGCLKVAYSHNVRVSACIHKVPNLRFWFLKRRLTNTTRCHRLQDGQL